MIVKLFDVSNGALIPTMHCYSLESLKNVVDAYPDNHLKVLLYVYYMTYPDPDDNPFFNMTEEDREEFILKEINADFSTDNPVITKAIDFCNTLYDTPTKRAYKGIKIMMDKLARFFETQSISTGRDGSLTAMVQAASKYSELRESFKGIEKDYLEEVKTVTRGDSFTAYDQR